MKVLFIEDSATMAEIIRSRLTPKPGDTLAPFQLLHAVNLRDGLSHLSNQVVDIILLDLNLPDSEGLDTFYAIWKAAGDIPIVIMTVVDNDVSAMEAIRQGAQDYLIKEQLDYRMIVRILRYAVERQSLRGRLVQSQMMETASRLAAGLAHKLNNQLTPVLGYVELARMQLQDRAALEDALQKIEESGKRCAQTVHTLINCTRESLWKKTSVDVPALLEQTRNDLTRLVPSSVLIEVDCDKNIRPVLANAAELETVLINLGTNSWEAMSDGGRIRIEAKNIETGARGVRIRFLDTGLGIAENIASKIFEPFFTTKNAIHANGLGLSLVHNVIKNHGGRISLVKCAPWSTVFEIDLLSYSPSEKASAKTPSDAGAIKKGSGRVFFVDDEAAIRNLALLLLQSLGYDVLSASDGEEAVRVYAAKHSEIDIVVMDVTMPKLTGIQAMKKMLEINPNAKIILTSGYTSEKSVTNFFKEGAREFLPKPYSIQAFSGILHRVLNSPPLKT